MKILVLTREYPPRVYGGAGVHVEHLTRELARFLEVEVRCFGSGDREAAAGEPTVRAFDVPSQSFAELDPRLRKALEPLAIDLRMLSSPVDAHVVHCHTWYTVMAGLWVKKLYGLPFVVTTHSLEPLRPWKAEQLGRGYDLSSWIERAALEEADRVIAVSDATRREVLECYDLDPEKVRVVHNGIDLEEYRRRDSRRVLEKYGISREKPYLLFVGRVTRQKGVIHLVRALEHVDSGMQAVLCAGAPDTEEIALEMEEEVGKLQARRPGVFWIREMLPVEDAVEFYSGAELFVCPSVYEPFGIINLEAMACETPVVASRVGGIPEVVVEGSTGLLVPFESATGRSFEPRDPDRFASDLAGAINRLARDPEARRRMGQAGRRRVEEHFSWQKIARRTAELYGEIVALRETMA